MDDGKEPQSKFKRICVFCGSNSGNRIVFSDAALDLGNELVCLLFSLSLLFSSGYCRNMNLDWWILFKIWFWSDLDWVLGILDWWVSFLVVCCVCRWREGLIWFMVGGAWGWWVWSLRQFMMEAVMFLGSYKDLWNFHFFDLIVLFFSICLVYNFNLSYDFDWWLHAGSFLQHSCLLRYTSFWYWVFFSFSIWNVLYCWLSDCFHVGAFYGSFQVWRLLGLLPRFLLPCLDDQLSKLIAI